VLLWGSIYLTIGAACADLKDSQNLMVPATLLQLLPVMVIGPVMEQPTGTFARVLSLLPFSAPQMMLLRLGYDPAPPMLEIALSLVLLALTALAAVAVAARVLRVGLLAHGRTASLREIARWVRTG
ncbi:MAG TPA: ABC transporter permease, partial [Myxococcota bacterium]